MRLLNVETYELKEFFNTECPPYAILSHTWEQDEVLFRDMQPGSLATAQAKMGFTKIRHCCQQAQYDGYEWVWVDTCCIDKSSSSELSETINSMFGYYERADVCYAYLVDAAIEQLERCPRDGRPTASVEGPFDAVGVIKKTKWWKRGWTLQEFLAPVNVVFYDSKWNYITSKTHWRGCRGCLPETAGVTDRSFGINRGVVLKSVPLSTVPILVRMQMASTRKTTRVEDQAYCLLGIFDINMPLLYGEGDRAFLRFQEVLLAETGDYSLLAWGGSAGMTDAYIWSGIFAPSLIFFNDLDSERGFHNSFSMASSKPTIAGNTASFRAQVKRPKSVAEVHNILDRHFPASKVRYLYHAVGDYLRDACVVTLPLYGHDKGGLEKYHPMLFCLNKTSTSGNKEDASLVRWADNIGICKEGELSGSGWSSWTEVTFTRSCQIVMNLSLVQISGDSNFRSRGFYWAPKEILFQWRRSGGRRWEIANDWKHWGDHTNYAIFTLRKKREEGHMLDDKMAGSPDCDFGPIICCLRVHGRIALVESSSVGSDPGIHPSQQTLQSRMSHSNRRIDDALERLVGQSDFYESSFSAGSKSAPIAEREFQLLDGTMLTVKAVAMRSAWLGIPIYNVYIWLSIRN